MSKIENPNERSPPELPCTSMKEANPRKAKVKVAPNWAGCIPSSND